MNEKISVIIITRNRAELLAGCLDSLVVQTRIPNEVIVVDNASTDKTKKVIFSFKKKLPIRYAVEKQIGIPYARNKGVEVANGSLLLMLDDDCEADRFWVERMADAHKKYPKAWVIQGRTYSLPPTKIYSLLAEFGRFFFLRSRARIKQRLGTKNFFGKNFGEEIELLNYCDTRNFSIKTSYLKKHKLSFDENFYRGSDADLGRQIVQKNGLTIFCPQIQLYHWERSNLKEFLKQRWHIGRSEARIADKWKTRPLTVVMKSMLLLKMLISLLLFCNVLSLWRSLPALMTIFFLDRLYYVNGLFYEKKVLSLAKQ